MREDVKFILGFIFLIIICILVYPVLKEAQENRHTNCIKEVK